MVDMARRGYLLPGACWAGRIGAQSRPVTCPRLAPMANRATAPIGRLWQGGFGMVVSGRAGRQNMAYGRIWQAPDPRRWRGGGGSRTPPPNSPPQPFHVTRPLRTSPLGTRSGPPARDPTNPGPRGHPPVIPHSFPPVWYSGGGAEGDGVRSGEGPRGCEPRSTGGSPGRWAVGAEMWTREGART